MSRIDAPILVLGRAYPTVDDALAHARTLCEDVRQKSARLAKSRLRLGRFLLDLRPHVGYGAWETTLQAAGIPVHTARRAMRLARQLHGLAPEGSEPTGPVLEGRTLRSLELETGVRKESAPAPVILDRIKLGVEAEPVTSGFASDAPELVAAPDLPRIQPAVAGRGRRPDVEGQALLAELYQAVRRAKAELARVSEAAGCLGTARAAELRSLIATLSCKLDELSSEEVSNV